MHCVLNNHVFHQYISRFLSLLSKHTCSNMATTGTKTSKYIVCKKRSCRKFLAAATNFKTMNKKNADRGTLKELYATIPFSDYFIDNCQYLATGTDIRCTKCNDIFGLVGIRHIFLHLNKILLVEIL